MKLKIEIDMGNAAFHPGEGMGDCLLYPMSELRRILYLVPGKVGRQIARSEVVCNICGEVTTRPESGTSVPCESCGGLDFDLVSGETNDVLQDINGNTVGTVTLVGA